MSDAPAAPVTENGVPPATQEKVVDEAPGFKVFVGNLAYSTTDEGLKAFFAPVASDIISAQVIMRGTRSAGYGFVALTSAEAAQKAVEALDKKELDERPIIVEVAKPAEQKDQERKEKKARRRPGRRGAKAVPGEVTEAEANGETDKAEGAAPAEGEAEKPKKKKKKAAKKPKAEGETPAGEASAVEGEAKAPRKKRAPRPPRAAGEEPVGEPSNTVLFVANLGFNVDDAALAALFTDAGIKVNSARIVRRRWGRPRKSKGYGFVDVGDEAEQKKAIEALEGKEVGGRPIAVKIAVNAHEEDEEHAEGAAAPAEEKEATPEVAIVAS
ncbi:RNA-binding domain-containing protein [Artomyces pyxidatus]|uniref:RNA-binding domain-containing protein n=1 Tax=Artomyces pyxidatus TaxID=48021 RepID=A0ACB8TKU0_9AGAM|nr:RNA-binding domain-containing protein [Artomyces pyxidatus]